MKNILVIFITLLPFLSFSQKEYNNWYFGEKAAITFNSGSAQVLTNSQMIAQEGACAISDSTGSLLFYTNGVNIWSRNHSIMPDADSLMGGASSTHSALIVPPPCYENEYYVFTVDQMEDSLKDGFRYSIVDMNLDGGLGNIKASQKNIRIRDSVGEQLCAVMHKNKLDIWIIVHGWNSNNYYAYLLTKNGLSSNPVVSSVGQGMHFNGDYDEAIGHLKASKDGKKLVFAGMSLMELYKFDASTGIISDPVKITASGFGVEISEDGSKLYTMDNSGNPNFLQYDINAGDEAQINASKKLIPKSSLNLILNFQLGPDGKIYVFGATISASGFDGKKMGIINNPNEAGAACNFDESAIDMQGRNVFGVEVSTPTLNVLKGYARRCEPENDEEEKEEEKKDSVIVEAPFPIPTAFTPNGDGFNDQFELYTKGLTEFHIEIYNRWGQRVFKSDDKNIFWDGNINGDKASPGCYYFLLDWKPGNESNDKWLKEKGFITLIR